MSADRPPIIPLDPDSPRGRRVARDLTIVLDEIEERIARDEAKSARAEATAGADAPKVTVTPTRYEVSAIPEDNRNHRHFTINVEYRGDGKWAVCQDRYCLGADGIWDYEMRPSEREDEWLATHRFDLDTALELAKREAPKVTVNGWTVADVLARAKEQR